LTKITLIHSVSYFNLGDLGALFGGLNPPKPPVATGLEWYLFVFDKRSESDPLLLF